MSIFQLCTDYKPSGDQEQAIGKLLKSLHAGNRHQCLLGVTGSGKTFTMANIIAAQDRPVLVLSHNKTLAAQLYSELKGFFPHNAVEYFVSYFDYYQPEAYIGKEISSKILRAIVVPACPSNALTRCSETDISGRFSFANSSILWTISSTCS